MSLKIKRIEARLYSADLQPAASVSCIALCKNVAPPSSAVLARMTICGMTSRSTFMSFDRVRPYNNVKSVAGLLVGNLPDCKV